MLTWPAIKGVLLTAHPLSVGDLQILKAEVSAFIVWIQKETPKLPLDKSLAYHPLVCIQMQTNRAAGELRVTFPSLTDNTMPRLATAYFDTFNLLYPFVDRQNFSQIL